MALYMGQPVRSALNCCNRHSSIESKEQHKNDKISDHVNVAPSKKFTTFEIKKCQEVITNPVHYLNAFPVIYDNVIKIFAHPGGGNVQVRDYHLHSKQTGDKLYAIYQKKDSSWKMNHVSYTAADIIGILCISPTDLPRASFPSSILREIESGNAQIKLFIADVKQRTAWLKSKSTPWNKVPIYNKTTNIYGMNLIMTKQQFVKALKQFADKMDEEDIDLVPIIRCKDDVFHVQIAWIVELAPNRNIAIALQLNECKLMVCGIYLDINDVHKLAHDDRSCKCLSNFKCDIDRLQIGESEAMRATQRKLAKKTNEYNKLRKKHDAEIKRLESTCKQLQCDFERTQNHLNSLRNCQLVLDSKQNQCQLELDSLRIQQQIFQLTQYQTQMEIMWNNKLLPHCNNDTNTNQPQL